MKNKLNYKNLFKIVFHKVKISNFANFFVFLNLFFLQNTVWILFFK